LLRQGNHRGERRNGFFPSISGGKKSMEKPRRRLSTSAGSGHWRRGSKGGEQGLGVPSISVWSATGKRGDATCYLIPGLLCLERKPRLQADSPIKGKGKPIGEAEKGWTQSKKKTRAALEAWGEDCSEKKANSGPLGARPDPSVIPLVVASFSGKVQKRGGGDRQAKEKCQLESLCS